MKDMARQRIILNDKKKEQLFDLFESGATLIDIVKKTGLKFGYVQKASTNYWNEKMKSKNEDQH
jgi:hypothetical protein